MSQKSVRNAMVAIVLGVFIPAVCLADTLVINRLEYKDCRVNGIEGNAILFDFSGRAQKKPISEVTKIIIDNEPAFNNAEAFFAQKQWDKATDEYEKAVRATTKPWIKEWCSVRLLEAAKMGGRFDVVVRNYIAVALKTPDTAKEITLNLPKADSAFLPEAIKAAQTACDAASANPKAQEVLGKLLVDLYTAKGDAKGAEVATQRLAEFSARANPNSPETIKLLMRVKLAKINTELEAGKFDEVIKGIEAEAPNIIEPADQINMLWALAEARKGKLGGAGTKDEWKEIAIAYMRVVANGKAADPKVIDSLLKVAEIHATKLGDKPAAQAMLKRMIDDDYKGMEAAKDAQKLLEKLK
ncbi:MAG: tol-pal system YbgF family protein [Tepidisphaerales bacterium]